MRLDEAVSQGGPFLSLEFFPPRQADKMDSFLETARCLRQAEPLFVSVTCGAGGSPKTGTLEVCGRLKRECGYEPMPHLTCLGASRANVAAFLDDMRDLGLENVLALRGDLPEGVRSDDLDPGFRHASDLAAFIAARNPGLCVGGACYPDAHPESPSIAADIHAVGLKVAAGARFLVTQVVFDHRVYFDFVERLRQAGVSAPVIPGILPIPSLSSLRFILSRCAVRFPGPLLAELERAEAEGGPEAVAEVGLAQAVRLARALLDGGAPGAHLYTLNRAEMCLALIRELGEGRTVSALAPEPWAAAASLTAPMAG